MRDSRLFALSLIVLAVSSSGVVALQNEVGTTAAVNQAATGTPPGEALRTLYVGTDVVFEERISTSTTGLTQILFLDGSSITVGPNAELILDKFIYDPGAGTGSLTLEVVKGTFRLIGGKIGKTNGVTIKTPVATIGIRGSITQGTVLADHTEVTFVAGEEMSVESCVTGPAPGACETRTIVRPEFTVNVAPDIFSVEKATVDEVALSIVALESSGDQSGGASEIPTGDQVAAQNIDIGGSALDPASSGTETTPTSGTGTSGTTTSDPTTAEDTAEQTAASQDAAAGSGDVTIPGVYSGRGMVEIEPGNLPYVWSIDIIDGAVTDGEFKFNQSDAVGHIDLPIEIGEFEFANIDSQPDYASDNTISGTGYLDPSGDFLFYEVTDDGDGDHSFIFAGIPTPDAVFTAPSSFRVDSYALRNDFTLDSTIPFLRDDIASHFPDATVADLLVMRPQSGSIASSDDTDAVWAAMAIEGQGAAQKSLMVAAGGNLEALASGEVSMDGGLIGSARLDAGDTPIRLSSSLGTVPDGNGNHFFGDDLDFFVLNPNSIEDVGGTDTLVNGAAVEHSFDVDTTPAEYYGFHHVAMKTETPAGIGDVRTDQTLHGYANAIVETRLDGDVFPYVYIVATNDVATDMSIATDPATSSLSAIFDVDAGWNVVGDTDIDNFRFAFGDGIFIDDQLFGAADSSDISGFVQREGEAPEVGIDDDGSTDGFRSVMLTQGTAPTDSFLPADVTLCECDYLTWGYWSSEFRFDDPGGDNEGRLERIHIGTWVTGDLSDFADLPIVGTATYNGHAIGNVYNAGDQYIAVGNFENEYNFATRTGAIAITKFDGRDFAGSVYDLGGSGQYSGDIDPTSGISGGLEGSFFAGGGDPAAATAGQFGLKDIATDGETYSAIGTFAATK